jgi:hypothetical protein
MGSEQSIAFVRLGVLVAEMGSFLFTCLTGTKVQILTQKALLAGVGW